MAGAGKRDFLRKRYEPPPILPQCRTRPLCLCAARAKRAFIIHGWGATPADHWFAALSDDLGKLGYKVALFPLPDSLRPDFAAWQRTLAEYIGTPRPDDLFVAHSLGNISLLHYLSHSRPPKIGGLVLVSGFAGKLPALSEIEGYSIDAYVAQARLDLPAIRRMTGNTACIISANDPIVAPAESIKLANALGARVMTVPDAGHFLASDGFTELPQALQAVKDFGMAVDQI